MWLLVVDQYHILMPVPYSRRLHVLAELAGEEMLSFRNGKDIYPYCPGCSNSAYTPITGVLGCTKGDDPEVIDFSNQVKDDPDTTNSTKCPGYAPRTRAGTAGFQDEASHNAALVKEIPSLPLPDSVEGWEQLVHDATEDLKRNPETARQGELIEQGIHVINDDGRSSYDGRPRDYDQYDFADPNIKQADLIEDKPEVSAGDDDDELFAALTQAGLDTASTKEQQRQITTDVLTHWRGGLLASHLSILLINQTILEYQAAKGQAA